MLASYDKNLSLNQLKHRAQVIAAWRFEWVNDVSDLDKTRIHKMFLLTKICVIKNKKVFTFVCKHVIVYFCLFAALVALEVVQLTMLC